MTESKQAWYRVPMVWLLVAFPLLSVVGGFTTLWLALNSDDGLVVDDYYRRGREINRELGRDRAAAMRRMRALVYLDHDRRQARIELETPGNPPPEQLQVQLLHATRAGYDRELLLGRSADGNYRSGILSLVPGRYYIQLAAEDWRLIGSLNVPRDTRVRIVPAVAAGKR